MEINDLSNSLNSVSQISSNSATSKLQQNIQSDYSNATDDELMSACKQFESYFLEQVFKEMQKTVPTSEFTSSATTTMVDYVKDSMVQQMAEESTENNSLGLANMLYEQMKRNYE